jgi:hypothetical protein
MAVKGSTLIEAQFAKHAAGELVQTKAKEACRRMKRISTALVGFIIVALVSGIAVAQPASQPSAGSAPQSAGVPSGQGSMMGGGSGMGMGMSGMGGMSGMMGMGMMPMMMQTMQQDPKLMGRMMELHGEMMRMMGEAMIKRGKEVQQGK